MLKSLLTPVAVAVLAYSAAPALAWEEFSIVGDPGYKNLSITTDGATYDISSGSKLVGDKTDQPAGRFRVDVASTNQSHLGGAGSLLAGTSFYTFCVELTQNLASPTTAAMNYQVVASTAQVTTTKLAVLDKLFTAAGSTKDLIDYGTAFQAAVWEVVYEKNSTYDLTLGTMNFGAGSSNPVSGAALTWANGLFTGLSSVTPLYTSQVLHSDTNQDYLVMTAVPEPEGYALAFAGLACIGLFGRKFRAAKKA